MQEDVMKRQLERLGIFLIMQYTFHVNQAKYMLHLIVLLNLKGSK